MLLVRAHRQDGFDCRVFIAWNLPGLYLAFIGVNEKSNEIPSELVQRVMLRIPTSVHGAIDYAVAAGLLAAPELLRIDDDSAAAGFTRAMGLAAIGYSVCTDYPAGVVKAIPMTTHLRIDRFWAVALALGPAVFGFGRRGRRYWLPHVAVALAAGAVIGLSEPVNRSAD